MGADEAAKHTGPAGAHHDVSSMPMVGETRTVAASTRLARPGARLGDLMVSRFA